MVILDATSAPSFFAGHIELRKDECLQVAELFCGGFGGWSRAVSVLRHAGVRVHTSWVLEKDDECMAVLAASDPDLVLAETLGDFAPSRNPTDTVLIHEDFHAQWWRPIVSKRPTHIMCASPPCQPWSSAGQEAGLNTQDGQLLLQVADFAKATLIPVWVFEEVANFPKHEHYHVFVRAMQDAGYQCAWKGLFQLSEVSSTFRLRFFMIWTLKGHEASQVPFIAQVWQSLKSPSLARMDTVFHYLPEPLLAPCRLTAEVEAMYMNPQFMPQGRHGPRTPAAIASARIVHEHQQANCFMAQYHYQHQLPHSLLLRKGLMGCILQTPQGKRFAASPEVASAHGAGFAFLIPTSDRTAMRILGNALAVQHACVVLGLALQLAPGTHPDPAKCVELCRTHQMTARTTLLLEVEAGWIMCHPCHAGNMQARISLRLQIQGGLVKAPSAFRLVHLVAGHGRAARHLVCQVSLRLQLEEVLAHLHVDPGSTTVSESEERLCVDIPKPFSIPLVQDTIGPRLTSPCLHVMVQGQHFFLHRCSPDVFAQLFQVFRVIPDCEKVNPCCYDLAGNRHSALPHMPATILVTPDVREFRQEAPLGSDLLLQDCHALPSDTAVAIQVPYQVAEDWWLAFPTHLAIALGLGAGHSCFPPPEGSDMIFSLTGDQAGLAAIGNRQGWLRVLLMLACPPC